MTVIVGIRFSKGGKVYSFDPGDFDLNMDEGVIVETARGIEYGEVAALAQEVEDDSLTAPLKKVLRRATQEDIDRVAELDKLSAEAMEVCNQKIAAHGLDMKLVEVEYAFDNTKILFYFTADGRVDFRELVKDLAATFRMRIELRQIGVRDEAKMLGGLGPCGRSCCCSSYMQDFHPVSIKMAKEQGLSLNPTKISGLCGRLMCCLKYEQYLYEQAHKRMPRIGKDVKTPDGPGIVTEQNVLRESVQVRVQLSDGSYDMRSYSVDAITPMEDGAYTPRAHAPANGRNASPRGENGAPAKRYPRQRPDKKPFNEADLPD